MTFNHIEIPINSYAQRGSNWLIYDGPNISVIHDGFNRYIYLKAINTAVKFKEPNTSGSDSAFIIGSNSTNLYFLNPTLSQVRTINTNGISLNEAFYNLNDFNSYKDLQYTTNPTVNTFVGTSGTVDGSTLVVSGYLTNISPGLTVGSLTVGEGTLCYMYSEDNGATWQGPYLPFINSDNTAFLQGRGLNVAFIDGNWVFFNVVDLGASNGTNLFFVQSLGVDLIGNPIFDPYLETPTALLTNYQLPMVYFDNKIFFQDTNKTGYHTYDYTDDSTNFTVLANISAFTVVLNELRITTLDSCSPTIINALLEAGSVTVTSFNVAGSPYRIDIGLGRTVIDETDENFPNIMFTNSPTNPVNSSHTLHPSTLLPNQ